MKKGIFNVIIITCITALIIFSKPINTEAASASMNGPDTVHPGDTITVTLALSASGMYAVQGTLSYSTSTLTLISTSSGLGGWICEYGNNQIISYDNNMSNPTNGRGNVIVATFKVSDSAPVGGNCSVSVSDIIATNGGDSGESAGKASYSATITSLSSQNSGDDTSSSDSTNGSSNNGDSNGGGSNGGDSNNGDSNGGGSTNGGSNGGGPSNGNSISDSSYTSNGDSATVKNEAIISGGNILKTLSISGYELNPHFSSNQAEYTIGEVGYEVTSLDIKAEAADESAVINIVGNEFSVGENKVIITVSSTNGKTSTYVILVTRKGESNYKASSDGSLSKLTISEGILSPAFSPDIKKYVVYLPYEIRKISITGEASDEKAQGVTNALSDNLVVGANELKVICKAEDGSETIYTVTVVVMPQYSDKIPYIDGVTIGSSNDDTNGNTKNNQKLSIGVVTIILIVLIPVAFAGGAVSGYFYQKKSKIAKEKKEEDDM